MLIVNTLYLAVAAVFVASLVLLIAAIRNKNKAACESITRVSWAFLILMGIVMYLPSILSLPTSFEVLLVNFAEISAIILCITSIIVSSKKLKKSKKMKNERDAKIIIAGVVAVVLPVVALLVAIIANFVAINSSDLIVVYRSAGNGGLGDTKYFAYGINDNGCMQFDLGIDFDGYALDRFLPRGAEQVLLKDVPEYNISVKDGMTVVEKNGQQICSSEHPTHYSNNYLQRAFYIRH